MDINFQVPEDQKDEWDKLVDHPMQTWAWGEFRKTRQPISRIGFYENKKLIKACLIVWTNFYFWKIGYIPMGFLPTKNELDNLKRIGRQMKAIFIRMEPIETINSIKKPLNDMFKSRGLFKKTTYWWDLTKSESDLLAQMHQKGRYNIKIAKKNSVQVNEDNSIEGLNTHIDLLMKTAQRQKVSFHDSAYHQRLFKKLPNRIFLAKYQDKILASAMVFTHKNKAYYAFGGNSFENTQVMASTLLVWEMAKKLKSEGYTIFDLWGAEEGSGFSQFKEKFGAEKVEMIGAYDLVINMWLYPMFRLAEEVRWKIRKTIR